jgi:hypothetical protein
MVEVRITAAIPQNKVGWGGPKCDDKLSANEFGLKGRQIAK